MIKVIKEKSKMISPNRSKSIIIGLTIDILIFFSLRSLLGDFFANLIAGIVGLSFNILFSYRFEKKRKEQTFDKYKDSISLKNSILSYLVITIGIIFFSQLLQFLIIEGGNPVYSKIIIITASFILNLSVINFLIGAKAGFSQIIFELYLLLNLVIKKQNPIANKILRFLPSKKVFEMVIIRRDSIVTYDLVSNAIISILIGSLVSYMTNGGVYKNIDIFLYTSVSMSAWLYFQEIISQSFSNKMHEKRYDNRRLEPITDVVLSWLISSIRLAITNSYILILFLILGEAVASINLFFSVPLIIFIGLILRVLMLIITNQLSKSVMRYYPLALQAIFFSSPILWQNNPFISELAITQLNPFTSIFGHIGSFLSGDNHLIYLLVSIVFTLSILAILNIFDVTYTIKNVNRIGKKVFLKNLSNINALYTIFPNDFIRNIPENLKNKDGLLIKSDKVFFPTITGSINEDRCFINEFGINQSLSFFFNKNNLYRLIKDIDKSVIEIKNKYNNIHASKYEFFQAIIMHIQINKINKSNKDDLVIVENWHEFKNYPDIKEKFTNIVFKSCKNILLVTNSYHFLKDSQIWRKIDD
jgi:ABC-type polysaccharide/polyol phosphate export permease